MNKPIRDWLLQLPPEPRSKALANLKESNSDKPVSNLLTSLYSAFSWDKSPEGFSYWHGVLRSLKK